MNTVHDEGKAFVAYEYKTVKVRRENECLFRDSYGSFGWSLVKSDPAIVKHVWGPIRVLSAPLGLIPGSPLARMISDHDSAKERELTFRRPRDIPRKAELNRLQAQFEAGIAGIETLERSKTSTASVAAYAVAFVGTVLMGAATFSYLAGMLFVCVLLAVPGFGAWTAAYFVYKAVRASKTEQAAPLIDFRHDTMYAVCGNAEAVRTATSSGLSVAGE